MAEQHKDIDQLFRNKLSGQSINPSPMAWEKLEGRLSQKKKVAVLWIRIAASLLLLLGLTVLLWASLRTDDQALDILAENDPVLESIDEQPSIVLKTPETPTSQGEEKEEVQPIKETTIKKATPRKRKQNVALTEPKPRSRETIAVREVEAVELPPLDMDQIVGENETLVPEVKIIEKVAYKVTIISNGIKTSTEKETLVGEIENRIDQIGGLLVKVDQGFADLQDAKNSLFSSITAKK